VSAENNAVGGLGRGLLCGAGLLLSGLIVELGACGDSAAPGGNGAGGSGGSPAEVFATSDCGACLVEACDAFLTDCQSSPDCADYLECLLACPLDDLGNADAACDEGCVPPGESSEALAGRVALTNCRTEGPGAACAACIVEEPAPQVCEPSTQETPCLQCYADSCCDTREACFGGSNPDCEALFECMKPCGDVKLHTYAEPCIADCFAEHPASVDTLVTERQCAFIECANETKNCDATDRNECHACLYGTCADPLNTLVTTEDGYLMWFCTVDCDYLNADADCYIACADKYPAHEEEFLLWAECASYACDTLCQG
jgi:hypothetical protein